MKTINMYFLSTVLFCFTISVSCAQEQEIESIDTAGFKTFLVEEGDNTFLLKQYFFAIYTRGDTVLTDSTEKVNTQSAHLNHLGQLEKDRKLCIAGPFGDDGDWRGILMLSVKTEEEAIQIMNSDPAVIRGTLKYILKPVWAGVGSTLH